MKISYIPNLIVETSRRCNAGCLHCLRGSPQELDLKQEVLTRFFQGLSDDASIDSICIGGGEPALAVKQIALLRKNLERRGIPFDSIFMVTSGFASVDEKLQRKLFSDLAIEALRFYAATGKNEPELCGIALSEDQFHPYPDPWVRSLLSGLSFFQPDTKRVAPGKTQYLIREGRAKALEDSPGEYRLRDLSPTDWAVDQIDTNIDPNGEQILQICDGQLYLCANGNIVNCCDFSYEHADLDPVCSVFETNWPERWYRETLRRKKRENPDA